MRELAQAKRHYSKLPLFAFLRADSIPARDRLAFYPCMASFVQAFSDLNRFVLRAPASDDPYQRLIDERAGGEDSLWSWYLDDFAALGFDRGADATRVLQSLAKDESREGRMIAARLAQLLEGATALERLVVSEAIEAAGSVLSGALALLAAQIEAGGELELRYLGQAGSARAADLAVREPVPGGAITLTSAERQRCLDLSFQVFDVFADWSAELLAYAKNSLARRAVPHLVHSTTAAQERGATRLT
jgi:hypothetical protein